jgi:hypothetical protein
MTDIDIGLFICASLGLIIIALVAGIIILIGKEAPEIDPVDYDWVLLNDTEADVLAYHKKEFVLQYHSVQGAWELYDITSVYRPLYWNVGPLTHPFMESLDSHIERYSHD